MKKVWKWAFDLFELILFSIMTAFSILTTFVLVACILIGIPIILLVFIRDFFPDDGELTQFGFVFSWYDLIIYIPAIYLVAVVGIRVVIPVVWLISKTMIKFRRLGG